MAQAESDTYAFRRGATFTAEEMQPAPAADDGQDYHDALVNILWVCGQKGGALDGLRGQLEQIAGIARGRWGSR